MHFQRALSPSLSLAQSTELLIYENTAHTSAAVGVGVADWSGRSQTVWNHQLRAPLGGSLLGQICAQISCSCPSLCLSLWLCTQIVRISYKVIVAVEWQSPLYKRGLINGQIFRVFSLRLSGTGRVCSCCLVVSHCFDLKIRWISNRILTVATRLHLKFRGIVGPQPRADQVNWVICPDSWLVEVALDTVWQCKRGAWVQRKKFMRWRGGGKEQQFHGAWQWQSGKLLCCPIKLVALCGFRPTHATRSMLHTLHTPDILLHVVCATRISCHMQISLLLQVAVAAFFSQRSAVRIKDSITRCDATWCVRLFNWRVGQTCKQEERRGVWMRLQQPIKMMDDTLIVNSGNSGSAQCTLQQTAEEIAKTDRQMDGMRRQEDGKTDTSGARKKSKIN